MNSNDRTAASRNVVHFISHTEFFQHAAAESPPPITSSILLPSATSLPQLLLYLLQMEFNSNTPIGPFQMNSLEFLITSASKFHVF